MVFDYSELKFLPLDNGALVYITADAKQARSIIDLLPLDILDNKQVRQMVNRTDFFSAALFPSENERGFQVAAYGNYPNSRASMAFTFSRQWKKQKAAGDKFWYSSSTGVSLLLKSNQAFAVTGFFPANPVATLPGKEPPAGFFDFSRQAPLSLWVENASVLISGILRETGLPLQFPVRQMFLNFYPVSGNNCQGLIRLQFDNATYARGMLALINLTGNFMNDSILASLFLSNPPVLNGSNIDIRTSILNEDDIIQLFNLLTP